MKLNNKVLVLGYFGYTTNQLDGQTVKTRSVYEMIKSKKEEIRSLDYFDTQQFSHSIISPFHMVWKIIKCNKLIYVPAHNSLKYLFPFIYFISKMMRINILYIVVGGWLTEYLRNKKLHVSLLSNIQGIFPQSNQLTNNLRQEYSFKNVNYFPNFRIHSFEPSFRQNTRTFKIVYMARIFRMKGVDAIFRLAKHIDDKYKNGHSFIIDFYGPIVKDEEEYFKAEIEKFAFVSYLGVLEPDQIYSNLNEYDLLVLPTRYSDEGFPGTILDAYYSGVPVIASNWRFLPEFVDHGNSGYLFDLDKEEDFYAYTEHLFNDREKLLKMKHFAFEKSKEFSPESAWQIMKPYLVN